MNLKRVLKRLRYGKDMPIAQAAERIGISIDYLDGMECGRLKNPSPIVLSKIAEVYGTSYIELMKSANYLTEEDLDEIRAGAHCKIVECSTELQNRWIRRYEAAVSKAHDLKGKVEALAAENRRLLARVTIQGREIEDLKAYIDDLERSKAAIEFPQGVQENDPECGNRKRVYVRCPECDCLIKETGGQYHHVTFGLYHRQYDCHRCGYEFITITHTQQGR